MAWGYTPAPTVIKAGPQKTTGTAKFPAAPAAFKPGTTQIVNGTSSPVILGPGAPQQVAGLPGTPAAPAAAAPAAPAVTPDGSLDATALQNIAQNQFSTNQKIAGLNQKQAYNATDLQKALAQLAQQQPLDTEKATQSYNDQGLLYSGHLGQALGQLAQSYGTKTSGLQDAAQRSSADIAAQIAAAQQGEQLYEQGQGLASTARRTALAASDQSLGTQALTQALASVGQPAAAPPSTAPAQPVVLARNASPVVKVIPDPAKGGVIHVHADGTRVFVKGGKA